MPPKKSTLQDKKVTRWTQLVRKMEGEMIEKYKEEFHLQAM